jgi:hypothetical protein
MYISGENLLIISLLINGLLGGISSLWLRMPVLVPFVAFAILESVFLTTTLLSAFMWGLVLIWSLEIGYLVGAAFSALWSPIPVRRVRDDFTVAGHVAGHIELSDH